MAFQNYFIKVGNYEIPLKYMEAGTYSSTKNILDEDPYYDANGVQHREVLEHVPYKAEFETVPMMTEVEFNELMSNIENNFTVAKERKANVTIYVSETRSYITQEMYIPNFTPKVNCILNGELRYDALRLAFIGN